MESDSCQEGSGLPCPLHRKSRGKRSAWRQAASVYCLVALPLYRTETHWPRLTTENVSASSHGTLFQWGANGRENGGTFFFFFFLTPNKDCLSADVWVRMLVPSLSVPLRCSIIFPPLWKPPVWNHFFPKHSSATFLTNSSFHILCLDNGMKYNQFFCSFARWAGRCMYINVYMCVHRGLVGADGQRGLALVWDLDQCWVIIYWPPGVFPRPLVPEFRPLTPPPPHCDSCRIDGTTWTGPPEVKRRHGTHKHICTNKQAPFVAYYTPRLLLLLEEQE